MSRMMSYTSAALPSTAPTAGSRPASGTARAHLRLLTFFELHAVVVDHDPRPLALDHRALLGEVQRNHLEVPRAT